MNRDSGGAPTETLGYPVCTVEERFNLRGRRYYEHRVVGGNEVPIRARIRNPRRTYRKAN